MSEFTKEVFEVTIKKACEEAIRNIIIHPYEVSLREAIDKHLPIVIPVPCAMCKYSVPTESQSDVVCSMYDSTFDRDFWCAYGEPKDELKADEPETWAEDQMHDVVYLCDQKFCKRCDYTNCKHTKDIRHAKNFKEIVDGVFAEEEHE